MSKTPLYICSKCDAQFPKWAGRCTACGGWGTVGQGEELGDVGAHGNAPNRGKGGSPSAPTISFAETAKISHATLNPTGISALDEVLGGGLVDGSVTLVAGEPGIGKSTLLAQLGLTLAGTGKTVLYVTGEESPSQIKRRLDRLCSAIPASFHFLDHTDADVIAATIEKNKPSLTIVDSIQSLRCAEMSGEAGSVGQVKACAATITGAAKVSHAPVILVGQVTKDGDVAGPRVLEHVVDTVLFLEGDSQHRYRLLRALKHRFGPTDEVALFTMTERGLTAVEDASSELLRDRAHGVSGSSVTCLLEGHRPMLLEIQALVSPAGYGTPVRRGTGVDTTRLGMLLAVLARRAGLSALEKDIYANAAGGIDARDPSVDLAICAAIASALKDAPLDPRLALFGEVGLGGELRPVGLPESRLKEMARLGFTTAIVPKGQGKLAPRGMEVKEAASLKEAFTILRIV